MMHCTSQWQIGRLIFCLGVICLQDLAYSRAEEPEKTKGGDEKVGEVLGKPVYRSQLKVDTEGRTKLRAVFFTPVVRRYTAAHRKELEPTKAEIAAATVILEKEHKEKSKEKEPEVLAEMKKVDDQLAKPDLSESERAKLLKDKESLETALKLSKEPLPPEFANFMLMNWKFQKHLYDNFGGGRLVWQQAGIEALDAMHKWLETQEKAGEFKITDKELRDEFYKYWTTLDHGPFLIKDPERIKKEFLEVEWAPRSPAKAESSEQR